MLRAVIKLPGVQVFSSGITSAADQQDVAAAYSKVSNRVFHVAQLLGRRLQPPQLLPGSNSGSNTPGQLAALRRLQQRAEHAELDIFDVIVNGDLAQWERMVCSSLHAGMSLDVQPSTAQDQFVQELRLALWLGRTLGLPSDTQVSVKRHIEYKGLDGKVQQLQVDLAFPANSRTITRLMEAWWARKGGRPAGGSSKKAAAAAAAAAGTAKPQYKAMPVSFNCAVEKLLYWQDELTSALIQINSQLHALKESGHTMWFHPSSLTSGGQFATTSAAFRARQAAHGVLATAQHLYLGSRQAETVRGCWDHSSVPGLEATPPVWTLGLSGLLPQFQNSLGTGFSAAYYHAKGFMDFGTPEYHDILPAACRGLCLASITALAFAMITYLQPLSPAEAIVKQQRTPCSASSASSSSETQHTPNNPVGFILPYGGLQHVSTFGEVTPAMVNSAVAGAKFLGNSFDKSKGSSAPPANLMQLHNRPSLYSLRSMHAGEVHLIIRQLPKASLPSDLWDWYMARAGRSAAANSYRTYVENYMFGFGPRPYAQHAGRDVQVVSFKRQLLGWCPSKANSCVVASLDEAGTAQLQQTTELVQLYSLNKCTSDIWQAVIDHVEAEGSLSGMLRRLTVPLMHAGYELAKCKAGCDWQYQHMSAAEADARLQRLQDSIHASNAVLYGADRLPATPACPVLLQSAVCLLAADWDAVKSSFASPTARSEAALAAAAAAAVSALQAAAQTARHIASGNAAAADASAAAADSAAAAAGNNARMVLALATAPAQLELGPATGPAEPIATATEAQLPDAVQLESAAAALAPAAAAPPTAASTQPAGAITLLRGAGLLLLVPNSKVWRRQSKALGGSINIRNSTYSHYTVAQLMTPAGLLLQDGQQQRIHVRVAGEFVADGQALSGNWAKQQYPVDVWPGETLLLWEQPGHKVGRKFCGAAASFAYPALYSTFTDHNISAAVGALQLDGVRPQQRAAATAAAFAITEQQQQPAAPTMEPTAAAAAAATAAAAAAAPPPHHVGNTVGPSTSTAAMELVTDLAMASSGREADAAHAAAVAAAVPLLRLAGPGVSASVRQGIKQLYVAACSGAPPPAAVLQAVISSSRGLATAVTTPAAANAADIADQRHGTAAAAAAAAASGAVGSNKRKLQQLQSPPASSDGRPGVWVDGEWVQLGDHVFMHVESSDYSSDPASFVVAAADDSTVQAHVWLFRVEHLAGSTVHAGFYQNDARDFGQPLHLQRKTQQLRSSCITGIVHVLQPESGRAQETLAGVEAEWLLAVQRGLCSARPGA